MSSARAALAAWRTWWADRQPVASGAWQPAELGYALSATTADATLPIYRAERFGGGTLDWTAFDVASSAGNPLTAAAAKTPSPTPAPVTSHAIPVPVTFHGSPVGRYWQLEDAQTDLGALDTYPTELGKLLLAEFTACFAGDWYRLPVRVPYGSAVRIEALVSTDTFGVATLVPAANAAAGARPWRMYEHSNVGGPAPGPGAIADGSWLLVPPVLAGSMDSAPVEEIVLVRDPAADLVWGIEHIVTNAVGRPVRRSEDLLAQGRVPAPDPRDGLPDTWVWRLATTVPENWIPLLPTRGRADNADYLLIQGAMVRYSRAADGTLTSVPILPASLQLRSGITLPEREVPREGVTLRRNQPAGPLGRRQPGAVVGAAEVGGPRPVQQRPRLRRSTPDQPGHHSIGRVADGHRSAELRPYLRYVRALYGSRTLRRRRPKSQQGPTGCPPPPEAGAGSGADGAVRPVQLVDGGPLLPAGRPRILPGRQEGPAADRVRAAHRPCAARILDCVADLRSHLQSGGGDGWLAGCRSRSST